MRVELFLGPRDGDLVELPRPLPEVLYVPLEGREEDASYLDADTPVSSEPRFRQGRYVYHGLRRYTLRRVYRWEGEVAPL